ncbi:aconitate hydratase [Pestalotiopsis sp. IQ-011]
MQPILSLSLLATAALGPCQNASAAATAATTTTTSNLPTAVGGNTTVGYYKYQNIRFAAVPTGDLRWAAPEWPPQETEVNTGDLADADVACSSSEDCLYLDVWAPADAAGRDLPVVVWTYGGGFTGGSKAENTPEGLFDLSTDFVFVSYNYRLGMTGLANVPSFNHQGGIANTAIWDVTHAFEWVQKYTGNFGGNPDDVTAVGFSAGGSQVLFQMTRFAGRAEQLFHKAYAMSPGFVPGAGHYTAEAFWQNVSTAAGCAGGDISCMRASDYGYQFQPRADGLIVADTGRFDFSGPVVATHELHEADSQAYSGVGTDDDVEAELRAFFPGVQDPVVDQLLEDYPADDYESPGLRFADMKQHFDPTAHNFALTNAMKNQTWNDLVALDSATHGTDQSYYWYSTYTLDTSSDDTTTTTSAVAATSTSAAASATGTSASNLAPGGPGGSSSANATVAWAGDKLFWPRYNESGSASAGTELVFNMTMYTQDDDLVIEKVVYWNKALWY